MLITFKGSLKLFKLFLIIFDHFNWTFLHQQHHLTSHSLLFKRLEPTLAKLVAVDLQTLAVGLAVSVETNKGTNLNFQK